MLDEFKLHVYPTDCDIVGHVNHAIFLEMLERARWAALESRLSYTEYSKSGLWAVVRHVEISYESQAFPGDDLVIRTGLISVGNTSFILKQEVRNAKDVLICDAKIVYVTVGKDARPIPVPDGWRNMFTEWK